jgi:hypothetical protein
VKTAEGGTCGRANQMAESTQQSYDDDLITLASVPMAYRSARTLRFEPNVRA